MVQSCELWDHLSTYSLIPFSTYQDEEHVLAKLDHHLAHNVLEAYAKPIQATLRPDYYLRDLKR